MAQGLDELIEWLVAEVAFYGDGKLPPAARPRRRRKTITREDCWFDSFLLGTLVLVRLLCTESLCIYRDALCLEND